MLNIHASTMDVIGGAVTVSSRPMHGHSHSPAVDCDSQTLNYDDSGLTSLDRICHSQQLEQVCQHVFCAACIGIIYRDTRGNVTPTFWRGSGPPMFRTQVKNLRRIRGDLRRLNYTKTIFGCVSTPDPARELTSCVSSQEHHVLPSLLDHSYAHGSLKR